MLGGADRGQRVHLVVFADQRPLDATDLQRAAQHVEGVRLAACAQGARLLAQRTEAHHLAPAAARQHPLQRLVARIDDEPARARHRAHQVMELGLDRGEVREDVGVVHLQVVQDRSARPVVHELAALVEQRGVVFVGLDDEGLSAAQASRDAEVLRHAADQETRVQTGRLQDPGQHRRGRGLAVRAGHRQHVTAEQHVLGQPLRAAGVGRAGVEDGLHQRIAARDDVADDEDIGLQGHLVGREAFDQLDVQRAQLVAHRRVDVRVAAGDPVARFTCDRCDATHEGAADAEDMEVHGAQILGRCYRALRWMPMSSSP